MFDTAIGSGVLGGAGDDVNNIIAAAVVPAFSIDAEAGVVVTAQGL